MVCKTYELWQEQNADNPFQSLLCWIMVCKGTWGTTVDVVSGCFNPCYVGLWSVRLSPLTGRRHLQSFNPCYVGLWSVRLPVDPGRNQCRSFNPCYVGLWSVSFPAFGTLALCILVSILVMLDYGL